MAQLGGDYSLEGVIQAFQDAGLDAVSHYLEHGIDEGLSAYDEDGNVVSASSVAGSGGGGSEGSGGGGSDFGFQW